MSKENSDTKLLSLVVSAYNEEEVLENFYSTSKKVLDSLSWDYEIIFVNDGSIDKTDEIINNLATSDKKIKAIHFSRNFGHEAAMIAGIDYAKGDAIVCMDADLQHPPSTLPQIVTYFESGYDIVNMVRTSNKSAGFIKNITSEAFYYIINVISDAKLIRNASDFMCISGRAAKVLRKNYREKIRFLRGYVQNIGFKKINMEYMANERAAGKSKYSIKKLFKFSMNTIMCFSDFPLRLGIYAGFFAILMGLIMSIYTIISWAKVGTPNGYATIIVLICFMFAVLFFLVGIIGEYISILFAELKDRPIYIVEDMKNIEDLNLNN